MLWRCEFHWTDSEQDKRVGFCVDGVSQHNIIAF